MNCRCPWRRQCQMRRRRRGFADQWPGAHFSLRHEDRIRARSKHRNVHVAKVIGDQHAGRGRNRTGDLDVHIHDRNHAARPTPHGIAPPGVGARRTRTREQAAGPPDAEKNRGDCNDRNQAHAGAQSAHSSKALRFTVLSPRARGPRRRCVGRTCAGPPARAGWCRARRENRSS